MGPRSSVRIEHRFPKPGAASSNLAGGTTSEGPAVDSRKISEIVRGAMLLAVAVLLGIMLWKFYVVFPKAGISVKQVYFFPIAVIAAICWVTYRGIKIIITALRETR